MKTSFITGIGGQDGAYLCDLLLKKGYVVHGSVRNLTPAHLWRLEELGLLQHPRLRLSELDMTSLTACLALLERVQPDELYHLAGQSSVATSFTDPYDTHRSISSATANLLEAIRLTRAKIRFFQAGSAEIFGAVANAACTEEFPFKPQSPYGVAKLNAHWLTVSYRETFGLFGSCGILFNHESPLRGSQFVTRKITAGIAQIVQGRLSELELGNLSAARDWGYAPDYVDCMWRMLQAEEPDTFVIATGRKLTVREFVRTAFQCAGIMIQFSGSGSSESAIVTQISATAAGQSALRPGQRVVRVNPQFFRPVDTSVGAGDSTKARKKLDWTPRTRLKDLCELMVSADLARANRVV